jgi:hypothetical protein
MEKQFDIIRKTRQFLLKIFNELTVEEVNKIPAGFSNNIIWNFGHIIAAQQGVCYLRAGMPAHIDKAVFDKYKPDSKPEGFVDAAEIEQLKQLMVSNIDNLEEDLEQNKFVSYPAWTTRYGVEITSVEDAIQFLLFHEGLHIGYIMALRRAVKAGS